MRHPPRCTPACAGTSALNCPPMVAHLQSGCCACCAAALSKGTGPELPGVQAPLAGGGRPLSHQSCFLHICLCRRMAPRRLCTWCQTCVLCGFVSLAPRPVQEDGSWAANLMSPKRQRRSQSPGRSWGGAGMPASRATPAGVQCSVQQRWPGVNGGLGSVGCVLVKQDGSWYGHHSSTSRCFA